MSNRDDFNSAMRNPGGYSPASNYGGNNMAGRMGGNSGTFGGTQQFGNGYQMASQVPPAIARAIARDGKDPYGGVGPWPGGYATPVLERGIPPGLVDNPSMNPVVAALANRLNGFRRNPFQRYQTPQRPSGALSWPPGSMGHGSTWGGGQASTNPWSGAYGGYRPGRSMGAGQQGTSNWNSNTTNIRPTGSVIKDQSRVPQPSWGDSGQFGFGGRR